MRYTTPLFAACMMAFLFCAKIARADSVFSTGAWCDQVLTRCWTPRAPTFPFGGVRVIADPEFSIAIPLGSVAVDFEASFTERILRPVVGIQTNLLEGWLALDLFYSGGFTALGVQDAEGPIYASPDGRVSVSYALGLGISLANFLSFGAIVFFLDSDSFRETPSGVVPAPEFYFSIRVLEAVLHYVSAAQSEQ